MRGSNQFWHQPASPLLPVSPLILLGSRWAGITADGIWLHRCMYLLGHSIDLVNLNIFHYHSWVNKLYFVAIPTSHQGSIIAFQPYVLAASGDSCGRLVSKIYQPRESHYQRAVTTQTVLLFASGMSMCIKSSIRKIASIQRPLLGPDCFLLWTGTGSTAFL